MLAIPLLFLAAGCILRAEMSVAFTNDSPIQTEQGYAQLNWGDEELDSASITYELQQSRTEDFAEPRTLYRGQDMASFVSGLPSGETWYRVRVLEGETPAGPWSPKLVVVVEYQSTAFVVTWLIIGLVVFVATVAAVVGGHARMKLNPTEA